MNKKVLWITTTAVFIALLVGVHVVTAPLAASGPLGQLVTGSLVNLVMIVSVMTCGLSSGLIVAAISPALAKFIGFGPPEMIVPFVMLGNAVLVLVWFLLSKKSFSNSHIVRIVTLITAAICKFAMLYIGIVKIAIPLLLTLPPNKTELMSAMFSFPQLLTALIGGALALAVLPVIEKVKS